MSSNAGRTRAARYVAYPADGYAGDMLRTPSTGRGRARSRAITLDSRSPSKRHRSGSYASTGRRSAAGRSTGTAGSSYKVAGQGADRQVRARRVTKKIKSKGRKKVVKVSADFRAKVKKVSEGGKVRGKFHTVEQNVITQSLNNGQATGAPLASGTGGSLFSASRVLHAASRLWNSKPANVSPGMGQILNMNEATTVIDVVRQYWKFRIRNNNARTIYLAIHKCQPKSQQALSNPVSAFQNALASGISAGYVIGTPVPAIETLYNKPQFYPEFNQYFTNEEIDVCIEPGQSYEIEVEGPKMVYDMKKFYVNTAYQGTQKQDIFVFSRCWTDLVGTSASTSLADIGRVKLDPTAGEIICESEYFCDILMPEIVGWQSAGVAPPVGPVALGNRIMRMVFDDFDFVGQNPANIDRTDEENPL